MIVQPPRPPVAPPRRPARPVPGRHADSGRRSYPGAAARNRDVWTTGQLAMATALAAVFAYQLGFNLLPDGLRVKMAALIAAGILATSLVSLFLRPQLWRVTAAAMLLGIGLCWLIGEAAGHGEFQVMPAIRFMLPLFFAVWLMEYRVAIRPRVVLACAAAVLLFALVWVLLHPQEIVNNLLRFSPFTGGEDGAHASAYTVALCALIVHQLRLNGEISRTLCWSLLGLAAVLLLGLRVVTPIFMLMNYGLVHVLLTRRLSQLQKFGVWCLLLAGIVAVLLWHASRADPGLVGDVHVQNLGSGRIGTWVHRIDLLGRRELPALLFGSGPGSDRFTSTIWWWEAKDSHHDLLMVTIESGLFGLAFLLLFLFFTMRGLGRAGLPLFWCFLSASMVSNALVSRPYLGCLFWIAAALAGLRVSRRRRRVRRRGVSRPPPGHGAPPSRRSDRRPAMAGAPAAGAPPGAPAPSGRRRL